MRTLIVEDQYLIAADLQMTLEGFGHTVVGIAATVAESIAFAAAYAPDVALIDLRLKNDDSGEEAAWALYKRFDVRCIFVSGNIDGPTKVRLRALKPYGFVGKPILRHHLWRVLEAVGDKRA